MDTVEAPASGRRLAVIDVARGAAICGMVAFHVKWDLNDWGWQEDGPAASPSWMALGHAVAATFLFVSGYCLVLARRNGTAAALRRIGILAGAAALISLVTRWIFPDAFIFFGILHCIAASNLVGLAFVRAPVVLTIIAACAAAALPSLSTSTAFDAPQWWWLGLSAVEPATLDYRPILPWIAAVLFGIAAAQAPVSVPNVPVRAVWLRGLAWAGRRSLQIYMIHQPMLFGLFLLLSTIHPRPAATRTQTAFSRNCIGQCVAAGAGKAGCEAACACVIGRTGTLSESPTEAELRTASEICVSRSTP